MIRSENGKFVFVHIQKSAGTSIESVLKNNFPDSEMWHGRHGHAKAGIREIGQDKWDKYFSFAFVRNPWDRMVSWYAMIQEQANKLPLNEHSGKKLFQSSFWNQVLLQSHDFGSFLQNCTEVVYDRGCEKSYAFNQLEYLTDESGELAVSFVGRFEDLAIDTSNVFDRLGIYAGSLQKRNTSRHGHYRQYYNRATRELVAKRFQKDIEAFGYEF